MPQDLGIYIHIPFCVKKCLYCDFCSFSGTEDADKRAYTDELCRRLVAAAPRCRDRVVETVYFGGGTPTLLPIACFERLLGCLRAHYRLAPDCEITCECNPATADRAELAALRALGINRLSVGLQSVHDRELTLLGRVHGFDAFRALFADARSVGFDNISVDLMYGIPEQTVESFRESLTTLAALSPEHISAYGLKIEEGTPFAKAERLPLPDEDTEWEMYLLCTEVLSAHGYHKYEISNFAKDGRESRHNLRYWRRQDYLGFGVAAHSCFEGERFGNSRDLRGFLEGKDITDERVVLNDRDTFAESIMLGLRLTEGLDLEDFRRRFGKDFEEYYPPVTDLIRRGFMTKHRNRLAFTDRGFFVSNAILSDLPDPN